MKGVGWEQGDLGRCTVEGRERGQEYRARRRVLRSTEKARSGVIKKEMHGTRAHEFFGGGFPR